MYTEGKAFQWASFVSAGTAFDAEGGQLLCRCPHWVGGGAGPKKKEVGLPSPSVSGRPATGPGGRQLLILTVPPGAVCAVTLAPGHAPGTSPPGSPDHKCGVSPNHGIYCETIQGRGLGLL